MDGDVRARVEEVEQDPLEFTFVLSDGIESAVEVLSDLWDGLYAFVVGSREAKLVFERFGRVEKVGQRFDVVLGLITGVQDRDVGSVNLSCVSI
jgi:hypothetical protein